MEHLRKGIEREKGEHLADKEIDRESIRKKGIETNR
jgi:hypothetical protein